MSATNTKTQVVERLVARLAGWPLLQENVFFSAQFQDGKSAKEVSDLLIVHRNEVIAVSVKSSDKDGRDQVQLERWLCKNGQKALRQLRGAIRSLREHDIWCEQPGVGRRSFGRGELRVRHAVSLFDTKTIVPITLDQSEFDAVVKGAPTTVLSVDDFLNTLMYLRTWNDLCRYLDSRWSHLRHPAIPVLGQEHALFCYYTAHRDSFAGCRSVEDARLVTASAQHVVDGSAFRDREMALAAILEELMANLTSARPTQLPWAHPKGQGSAVLRSALRDDLCDLSIQERAAIGEQIGSVSKKSLEAYDKSASFGTLHIGRLPGRVYLIFVDAHGTLSRDEGMTHALNLTIQACMHFQRQSAVLLALGYPQGEPHPYFHIGRIDNVEPSDEMLAESRENFSSNRPRSVVRARR